MNEKKSNLKNYSKGFYVLSTCLAFFVLIFMLLIFDGSIYPFDYIITGSFLIILFSPLGEKIFNKSTQYIRVLSVSSLSILASMLTGFVIPASIDKYYDSKGALSPSWLVLSSIFCFLILVVLSFIFAYMIFKKYLPSDGNNNSNMKK